jgi:hypothetical protein
MMSKAHPGSCAGSATRVPVVIILAQGGAGEQGGGWRRRAVFCLGEGGTQIFVPHLYIYFERAAELGVVMAEMRAFGGLL